MVLKSVFQSASFTAVWWASKSDFAPSLELLWTDFLNDSLYNPFKYATLRWASWKLVSQPKTLSNLDAWALGSWQWIWVALSSIVQILICPCLNKSYSKKYLSFPPCLTISLSSSSVHLDGSARLHATEQVCTHLNVMVVYIYDIFPNLLSYLSLPVNVETGQKLRINGISAFAWEKCVLFVLTGPILFS